MIFPILNGLIGWRKAPVTWALVLLNLTVLVYTTYTGVEAQTGLSEAMNSKYFVTTQGRIYAQYLAERSRAEYPDFLLDLGRQVESGESDRGEMLGQLAFRDTAFIRAAKEMDFRGDQVAFKLWRKKIAQVEGYQDQHPSFTLGLNSADTGMGRWVSYIFVHSGWLHFAGNMLFLVIFGAALERQIGGLGFLTVFLLSGIFAAGVFALMTGVTSSPLVGASGSVSGIMALYCILNWSRPERYFYWLFLPFRGFMGWVYLPAWVALALWMVNDLAGYLGTLPELGGVAHTAHLGGEVAGLIVGATLFGLRRYGPESVRRDALGADRERRTPVPMMVLIPFLPPLRRLPRLKTIEQSEDTGKIAS
ncbi:MAG: rhomboid family intramembrane serine protease [Bdellovibrionales bacterium]